MPLPCFQPLPVLGMGGSCCSACMLQLLLTEPSGVTSHQGSTSNGMICTRYTQWAISALLCAVSWCFAVPTFSGARPKLPPQLVLWICPSECKGFSPVHLHELHQLWVARYSTWV